MKLRQANFLIPILLASAVVAYFALGHLPSYTKWATILLILPSVYFLIQEKAQLEFRKLALVCIGAVAAGLLWDHVAIDLQIWNFPEQNVSGWFLGIPFEEYVFGVCFSIIVLGIYTSLPIFRQYVPDGPRLPEVPLLMAVFIAQTLLLLSLLHFDPQSYFKWLLVIAALPALFYLWRKGEKIDELRLCITVVLAVAFFVFTDIFFINSGSWFYYEPALLGRIGIIPIDDVLFVIFTTITVIGFYTSLPKRHLFTAKW